MLWCSAWLSFFLQEMVYFGYSRAVYVPAHPLLGGHDQWEGAGGQILSFCPLEAVYRISISCYACNWSKSLWCGGVVVWWVVVFKPILVFSLAKAEQ